MCREYDEKCKHIYIYMYTISSIYMCTNVIDIGYVTLEFSNTTPLPAKIYAGEGCAQVLFFESDEICGTSYKDRGGKYQGQRGVTLPKT